MITTPEQFDLYIKNKTKELMEAWKACPPTENEIMAKAIIDYQYNSIIAVLNAINKLSTNQHEMYNDLSNKLNKIEIEFKEINNK
jgi:hypothetical protein